MPIPVYFIYRPTQAEAGEGEQTASGAGQEKKKSKKKKEAAAALEEAKAPANPQEVRYDVECAFVYLACMHFPLSFTRNVSHYPVVALCLSPRPRNRKGSHSSRSYTHTLTVF